MIFCVCSSFQQETPFVYNNFGQVDHLHLDGSARIIPSGGILQLTNATNSQIGHVFYEKPIEFKSSESVSFSTYFVCALLPAGDPSGHGMTFFVSHSTDFKGAEATRYFGIFNRNGSTSTRVLAVELDTSLASDVKDISDNHVGIDVNSAESITSANASYFSDKEGKKIDIKLLSGDPIQVWVDYEGTTLNVSLAPLRNKKPSRPLLSSTSINLTDILQGRRMFVGFSGSTGSSMSYQYILGWSFSKSMASLPNIDISKLPKVPHSSTKKKSTSPVLSVLLGLIAFIVLGILVVAYLYRRNLYSEEVEKVLKLGLLCANLAPDSRPAMEQVVQYLNGNLALPEFWPNSPGIGVLSPMALSPAPLVIPSLSFSSSSSNNSMFITHSVLYGSGR
ncbi:unnamed protein product [Arabidopsis thaliana]|nr:unnamed protein product [Arabidopsis thaliana]